MCSCYYISINILCVVHAIMCYFVNVFMYNSCILLIYILSSYHCPTSQLEFNYAARRKTASRMIPVVMEERVRNTGTWDGEVGLVLGGRLYVDMCGDVYDDVYSEECIDDLHAKIIKIIKNPIKGLNSGSTIVVNNTSAEDMPTQVRPTPKKQQKNVKPLTELTVEEVSKLLEFNKLSKFVEEMKENDVDGPTLMETNNDEELKELGITLGVKARMFYKKLEMYKFHGVPFAELGIEAVTEQEVTTTVETQKSKASVVQHGDGTFTIAGATGGMKARVNGTFEIGDDMQNGLPVYVKVGDADTVIDLVKGISGWRWYIKQLKDKGPESSTCFAYAQVCTRLIYIYTYIMEICFALFLGVSFIWLYWLIKLGICLRCG